MTAAEALVCPAAEAIEDVRGGKGPGCHCRIAHSILSREEDSESLKAFCASDYMSCPIWKRNRRALYADQHRGLQREILATTPKDER